MRWMNPTTSSMAESGQNGQPALPFNPYTHPSGSGAQQDNREICKKFMWGICNKYSRCKFRHEFVFEKMKATLTFCHNFQNKRACDWPGCTFLHATKQEESDFNLAGVIPPALAERYTKMFAGAPPGEQNVGMFILGLPPPPLPVPPPGYTAPPLPPPVDTGLPPQPSASAPPPTFHPAQGTNSQSPRPPVTNPPPLPPPPPPPPNTASSLSHSATVTPALPPPSIPTQFQQQFQGTPYNDNSGLQYPLNRTSSPVLNILDFDASKPPPPMQTPSKAENGRASKRKLATPFEAGASKLANTAGQSVVCKNCVQHMARIKEYKKMIDEMISFEADKNFLYNNQLEESNRFKPILLSRVPTEKRREIERFIEGDCSSSDFFNNDINENNRSSSDFATVPKKMLTDLMKMVVESASASVGNSCRGYPGNISPSSSLDQLRVSAPAHVSQDNNSLLSAVSTIFEAPTLPSRPTIHVKKFADISSSNGHVTGGDRSAAPPRPTAPATAAVPSLPRPRPPSVAAPPPHYLFRRPPPNPHHPTDLSQPPPFYDMPYYRNYK